jgi:hypothetical protein
LTITGAEPVAVHLAIFPAHKKQDADRVLAILMSDARGRSWRGRVTVHEIAVETHNRSAAYPIHVDFSQDRTGFYDDEVHRAAFPQAAADWAFYLADLHPQRVEPGTERTWIFEPDAAPEKDSSWR